MRTKSWSGFHRYLARRMVERDYQRGSELARDLGIDPSVVNRWINGRTQPKIEHLSALAPLLKVPVLELLIQAGYLTRREVMDSFEQMYDNEQKSG